MLYCVKMAALRPRRGDGDDASKVPKLPDRLIANLTGKKGKTDDESQLPTPPTTTPQTDFGAFVAGAMSQGSATAPVESQPAQPAPKEDFGEFVADALGPAQIEKLKRKAKLPNLITASAKEIERLERAIVPYEDVVKSSDDKIADLNRRERKNRKEYLRPARIAFGGAIGALIATAGLSMWASNQYALIGHFRAVYFQQVAQTRQDGREAVREMTNDIRSGNSAVTHAVNDISGNTSVNNGGTINAKQNAATLTNIAYSYAQQNPIPKSDARVLDQATNGKFDHSIHFSPPGEPGKGNTFAGIFSTVGAVITGVIGFGVGGYQILGGEYSTSSYENYRQNKGEIDSSRKDVEGQLRTAKEKLGDLGESLDQESDRKRELEDELLRY